MNIVLRHLILLLAIGFTSHACYSIEIPEGSTAFELDGHIFINGSVNGVPATFIYDSGSDNLYLDSDYLASSALSKMPFAKAKANIAGAGNSKGASVPLIIDALKLQIGAKKAEATLSPVIGLKDIVGRKADAMIGNGILLDMPLEINYGKGYIKQHPKLDAAITHGYTKIPLEIIGNRLYVNGTIMVDGGTNVKGLFQIDTGSGGSVILSANAMKVLKTAKLNLIRSKTLSAGIGGSSENVDFRVNGVCFFDTIPDVMVSASLNSQGAFAGEKYKGVIGNKILALYDLIIDKGAKTLYLKRNGSQSGSLDHLPPLGLSITDRTDVNDGWTVNRIYEDLPASQAGISLGDIILEVDDKPVTDISSPHKFLNESKTPIILKVKKTDGSTNSISF